MNILRYSAFTVLPLPNSSVPCGHVTLVCAMHLRKAIVATDSLGISDYVLPGVNGVLASRRMRRAWRMKLPVCGQIRRRSLASAKTAQRYGAENCSEARIRSDLAAVLTDWQIPLEPEPLQVAATPAR